MAKPPSNDDAECIILATIFRRPSCIDDVLQAVQPEQFYFPKNRCIFAAVKKLHDEGDRAFDIVTVMDQLRSNGTFDDVGREHIEYLVREADDTPSPEYDARLVVEAYQRRLIMDVANEALQKVGDPACDVEEITSTIEARLAGVIAGEQQLSEAHIERVLERAFVKISDRLINQGSLGIPSGFSSLDEITGGFHENELTILAASAGTGKTAFVCNIATSVGEWARKQAPQDCAIPQNGVLIFSFEQGDTQLGERMLSIESRVNGHRIRLGQLDEQEQAEICDAKELLRRLPVFILDAAGMDVSKVSARARQCKARYGIGMVIVDYLQIVTADERIGQRERQVAEISRRLKLLAKELHVPVIALSQVNKDAEKREDKRPKLSDIRESGAIVADADVVMFLHRPDVHDSDQRPGEADLIVAKNRSGPVGVAELVWKRESLRFADREQPKLYY